MSAQVVRNFFPVLLSQVDSNPFIAHILTSIFPKHIQEICPLPAIHIQGDFQLKWPTVAAACLAGCCFGVFSGGHMLCRSASRKGFFSWGFAVFWYGLMCLGGLFYHCLLPSTLFRNLDVIGTACSSISIVAGSILADDTARAPRIALLAIYAFVAVGAVYGSQLVRELLYLLPTVAALVAAAWFVWKVNNTENGGKRFDLVRKWSVVAAAGALVGVGGVVCDKWFCIVFGSNFSLLFWFFVGCSLAMFAFLPIVVNCQISESEIKRS